ncbi:MAG TPA: response regulator transcription factor [Fimbriimonadaceae bacterium]|nr:response regulator transcription factor [Fimbriimonadaceae bacterium]
MDQRIRVMIAEDDSLLRNTLAELLKLDPEINLISTVPNGEQAIAEAHVLRPHVALMDIQMPKLDGISATRALKEQLPDIQVVILTKFGDDENVFAAIKAGAIGYVLKDSGLDDIRAAIRSAFHGEGAMNPALVARVLGEFNRVHRAANETRQVFQELSRREIEVLECIAVGMKNMAIADKLCLSEKTVKTHVTSIFKKLHVNDRTEAALLAHKKGLTLN